MMDGFLIIDKSQGMTSYTVIRRLKKIYPFKKIGYIGTLDRNATGILPVGLNEGVKLIPFLESGEKKYAATFILGVTSETFDMDGKIISETTPPTFDRNLLEDTLMTFKGRITQKVPLYSSKKVEGKPLYKWAHKGRSIEPPEKEVEVFDITFVEYDHPYVKAEITCSKGTYIRVIANDFGALLGCGAALYALKRTQHGAFTLEKSTTVEGLKIEQDVVNYMISLEDVLESLRAVTIDPAAERFLKNGLPVPLFGNWKDWKNGELVKVLKKSGTLLGVGSIDIAAKAVRIKRLINQ